MRLSKTVGIWLVIALVPLAFALAQQSPAVAPAQSAPGNAPAAMQGGQMMGRRMMGSSGEAGALLNRLRESLNEAEQQDNVGAIRGKIAEGLTLIGRLQDALNGRCGMAMGSMGSGMQGGQMMHGANGMMGGGMMHGANGMMGGQNSGSQHMQHRHQANAETHSK